MLDCLRKNGKTIIRWSRLPAEPHQELIGTIPLDPLNDAQRRGRHFKIERAGKPATDPIGHTPAWSYPNLPERGPSP